MIDPKTFERLKAIPEREWGNVYKSLIIYAECRLVKVGFKTMSEKDNLTGEDFAVQAIEKLFEGVRAWDFEDKPDLSIHLKGIVKSLISSHLKSSLRSVIRKTSGDFNDTDVLEFDSETIYENAPDEILITAEIWVQIEKEFGEDDIGFLIFCDWIDLIPPRTIASNYAINVKEVYNALKRCRRVIQKIFVEN